MRFGRRQSNDFERFWITRKLTTLQRRDFGNSLTILKYTARVVDRILFGSYHNFD